MNILSHPFWDNVEMIPFHSCYEWVGPKTNAMRLAHRISWKLTYGELNRNTPVDKICKNKYCVRPEHLFIGSHAECKNCHKEFISNSKKRSIHCSEECKKKYGNEYEKNRINRLKGYEGYPTSDCIVCGIKFKKNNSNQLSCSDFCSNIRYNFKCNELQKKYNLKNKNNPEYILKRILRTCMQNIIKQKILTHKSSKSHKYCDYSVEEFKVYIENKFKEGMEWSNWGVWHIDHIKPLCKFRLANEDGTENLQEILKANTLENLQPLWARDNLSKHSKWSEL